MFSMIPKGRTMRKKLHFRRYRVRRFPILAFWPSTFRIFYLINIFPGVAAATTSVNKYNKPAPHRVRITIIKASAEVSTDRNLTMPSALTSFQTGFSKMKAETTAPTTSIARATARVPIFALFIFPGRTVSLKRRNWEIALT